MRRTRRSNATRWLTRFGAPLAAVWVLAACGEEPPLAQEEDDVLALDLQSGERRRFKSREAVPSHWTICTDDACTIPPNIPCEHLGLRLCIDRPECKAGLVCELDFDSGPLAVREPFPVTEGDAPMSRFGSDGESVDCKMTCTTREPTSCEAATDERTCLGVSSARCEWAPVGPCWARETKCTPGTRCMPPPDCRMACRAAAPPPPPPVDPCQRHTHHANCADDARCTWISAWIPLCRCAVGRCPCSVPPPGSGECRTREQPDCSPCPDCCDPLPPPTPRCFVGGCSNEICSDQPGMVSPCIFPPPGGLPPKGAVCERRADGTCGWIAPDAPWMPESAGWSAANLGLDAYTGPCHGAQLVKYNPRYKLYVGAALCSAERYKLFLSAGPRGPFYEIADTAGNGQDHCELVNPSFSIPNEDDIRSGGCLNCEVSSVIDPIGTLAYVRARAGEPFSLVTTSDWGDLSTPWYECGVRIEAQER